MEGEGRLLKEASLSLQTSHSLRELPPRAPAFSWQRVVSFRMVRVLLGEVFVVWGGTEFWQSAAVAPVWCVGCVRFCKRCASADLSPLISRLRRQLPPEGKPSRNPFGFHNEINKVRRSRSFCVWGAVGYNALHERRALYCRERPMCRSVSIECNLVTCRSALCYGRRRLIPPHPSPTATPSPSKGKASIGSANYYIESASNFNPSINILQKTGLLFKKQVQMKKVTHHSLPL